MSTAALRSDAALTTDELCPGCGRRHLVLAHDGARSVFACASCGRRWVVSVVPPTGLVLVPAP